MKRMEKAEEAGNAQEEGVQIALEIIEKVKAKRGQGIHGIHIMAVGWEEIVPRLVTEAGLLPPDFVPPAPEEKEKAAIQV